MKKAICSLLICFVFMGCSPSPEAIQKAIEQTQTAMPTPTRIPLSDLQLDSLITQENDLPSGVSGAQISNEEGCDASGGNVCADYYISKELSYKDNKRGEVEIWVYEDATNNSLRYQNRVDSYVAECKKSEGQCYSGDPHSVPDLGDKATMIDVYNFIGADHFYITFSRCNTTIEVNWWDVSTDPNSIINYAKRLDKRLTEKLCY